VSLWEMPPRQPDDGALSVRRLDGDRGYIEMSHGAGNLVLSEYNAARLYAMLGLLLGIPLPKAIGKAIILVPSDKKLDVTMGFPKPKTLGERVAQALVVQATPERIGDFEKVTGEPNRCVHGVNPPSMCEHCGKYCK
jgi:hypothetical protein